MEKMGSCRTEVRTDQTPQIAAAAPATDVQWICLGLLPSLAVQLTLHHLSSGIFATTTPHPVFQQRKQLF